MPIALWTQDALHAAQSDTVHRVNQQVDAEHLLATLPAHADGLAASTLKAFRGFGVTCDRLMQALREVRSSQRVTCKSPDAAYEALEKYGQDLTKSAEMGKPSVQRFLHYRLTKHVVEKHCMAKRNRLF